MSNSQELPDLDPVIHTQPRLQIMTTLCALQEGDRLTFTSVQDLLGLTPGNLSTHLTKLETVGYVGIDKAFRGRRPVTWVRATEEGRDAFEAYVSAVKGYLV